MTCLSVCHNMGMSCHLHRAQGSAEPWAIDRAADLIKDYKISNCGHHCKTPRGRHFLDHNPEEGQRTARDATKRHIVTRCDDSGTLQKTGPTLAGRTCDIINPVSPQLKGHCLQEWLWS